MDTTHTSKIIDPADQARIEAEILQIGQALWERMQGTIPGLFNKNYWQGAMMEWIMKDPDFKVDMFRFVDVLPMLETSEQVVEHVREYLLKQGRSLPAMLNVALKAASAELTASAAAKAIKANVTDMAKRFIIGRDIRQALPRLRRLHDDGLAFTADILGEATISDAEADDHQQRYLQLIDDIAQHTAQWPHDPVIDTNCAGPVPRCSITLKISALDPHIRPGDHQGSVTRLLQRILPIFLRAKARNVFVNMDIEHWDVRAMTYEVFQEIARHPDLRDWPHIGIALQTYLKTASQDVEWAIALARSRGTPLTVRLVKGAYWDYEVVHARQQGLECPVLLSKADTDAQFEELTTRLLHHHRHIFPAFASHNLRSLTHALIRADSLGLPKNAYEFQMLYGMNEPMRQVFRERGICVRIYTPIGALLPGIAYLVRRLLENTSNHGFLRLSYHEQADARRLLARPEPQNTAAPAPRMLAGDLSTPFENCPQTDLTDAAVRQAIQNALDAVKASLPHSVPLVIGGRNTMSDTMLERYCPSDTSRLVATVSAGTRKDAGQAAAISLEAWPAWRDMPLQERAQLIETLADRLQADRLHLAALQMFEVGKPWKEADADVMEAIDFCRYYARQVLIELGPQPLNTIAGENNVRFYEGRGPAVIIAPWNFPLAILCGMTTAALVAGNTVIMKPAEQSSAVAYGLYQRMMEAGFPEHVVQFLPGIGEEVGAELVNDPHVAQIAFTGSKAVGLAIVEQAAKTHSGQAQVKRVVCEMGGKNAIIVDDDANVDDALTGIVKSAFGYAGQKCSACSRVLVVERIFETFAARLADACRSLIMAPAHDPACELGPVIDEDAYTRLTTIIASPGAGAAPLYVGTLPASCPVGWYVPPAVFIVDREDHPLMQREWFGPLLAVMKVRDFDDALRIAVSTEFALTGAVYSRNPNHLKRAEQQFRVGNLYFNRPSTGALVSRQPFGGFGMSGIGTQAGGPGYLTHFATPRCVSENTLRGGFTPDFHL